MRSSQEAKVYLETLKSILQYLGICDCKMQEGSIRCDVNVSVHKPGEPFGTRSEMKNVNSFSAAVRGIDYEVERQIAVLEAGGKVEQETRRWDDEKGMSIPMRSKEDAQDYRYFPEPDLLTIVVEQERVDELKKSIPELPNVKILRYVKKFGLNIKDATFIAESVSLAKLFDDCMAKDKFPAKCYTTWILGDLVKYMNATGKTLKDTKLTADNLTDLVAAIEAKTISNAGGKKVFAVLLEEDKKVSDIIKEQGLAQVSDDRKYALSRLPIQSGLKPNGSLAPINFLGLMTIREYAPFNFCIAPFTASSTVPTFNLCLAIKYAITSESMVVWKIAPVYESSSLNSSAFKRLPL